MDVKDKKAVIKEESGSGNCFNNEKYRVIKKKRRKGLGDFFYGQYWVIKKRKVPGNCLKGQYCARFEINDILYNVY